jgi:hypothetical protein
MRTLLLGLAFLAAPAFAVEEGHSVAVINLKFDDAVSAEIGKIRAAIQQAFAATSLLEVDASDIENQRTASKDLFACFSEDRCRAALGARLKTDYIFSGTITREEGALEAFVSLFDVRLGVSAKREQLVCPRCSVEKFNERLRESIEAMVRVARSIPQGTIFVRTTPPGADVKIDQRPVGTSNLEAPASVGNHTVEVSRPGVGPIRLSVEVKAGERRDVDLSIDEAPKPSNPPEIHPPPEKPPRFSKNMLLGLSGLTAGVLVGSLIVVGVGAQVLGDDGKPTCPSGPANQCRTLYDTQGQGGGMVAAGVVLTLASAALLGVEIYALLKQQKSKPVVAPTADKNGAGISIGGVW